MNLSIILLAYNEQDNIEKAIKDAYKLAKKITKKHEILVVYSERSTDNTETIIKGLMPTISNLKIIYQPQNKPGYGVALRLGINNAQYDYIFYTDGDNQFDINELENLIPYIKDYGIVQGRRKGRKDPLARKIYSLGYNLLIDALFFTRFIDVDCAFKLYRKRIFKNMQLKSDSGFIDAEILIKAKKKGFKIKTLPVKHYERKEGQSVTEGSTSHKISIAWNLWKELWRLRKAL